MGPGSCAASPTISDHCRLVEGEFEGEGSFFGAFDAVGSIVAETIIALLVIRKTVCICMCSTYKFNKHDWWQILTLFFQIYLVHITYV